MGDGAILAVNGPLIVLITIGFLNKFYWDRHKHGQQILLAPDELLLERRGGGPAYGH